MIHKCLIFVLKYSIATWQPAYDTLYNSLISAPAWTRAYFLLLVFFKCFYIGHVSGGVILLSRMQGVSSVENDWQGFIFLFSTTLLKLSSTVKCLLLQLNFWIVFTWYYPNLLCYNLSCNKLLSQRSSINKPASRNATLDSEWRPQSWFSGKMMPFCRSTWITERHTMEKLILLQYKRQISLQNDNYALYLRLRVSHFTGVSLHTNAHTDESVAKSVALWIVCQGNNETAAILNICDKAWQGVVTVTSSDNFPALSFLFLLLQEWHKKLDCDFL